MSNRRRAAPAASRDQQRDKSHRQRSTAGGRRMEQKGLSVQLSRIGLFISTAALLLAVPSAVAVAQEGLDMTTPYPAVTVDPGGSATFPLVITTTIPERVDLALTSVPEGWEARLRGGGSTIAAVFTSAEEPPEAAVEVDIPADAAAGSYQVVVEARTATASHPLTLDMTVEAAETGSVMLTSQFPNLIGTADDTFRFDLELENGTNQEATFSLETQAPAGWTVEAQPTGEEQAATTVVAAGGTARIEVTATPPPSAPAGEVSMLVRAIGGPQPAEAALTIEVTGSQAMSLGTADERLNARVTVGSSTIIPLVVSNDGSAPLTNVTFSATPPTGWRVEFSPATVAEILPESEPQAVQATLIAADTAIAGDYSVAITASSEGVTDRIELRTTVETSPIGGFIGLGLLAVVAVALLLVFRRYGRR